MTLLQELIDGASGSEVSVATLLRRSKVLAARLRTAPLADWVGLELNGYPPNLALPDYRGPFRGDAFGHFAGPFQREIRDAPIPPVGLPAMYREGNLFSMEFKQPVAELESFPSGESLRVHWPGDAIALVNHLLQTGEATLYDGMGLMQAWLPVPPGRIESILDAVRSRILDLALELEADHPDAGQPDSEPPPQGHVAQIVTNVLGGHANVAVASTNVQQTMNLPPKGDGDALLGFAEQHGVGGDFLGELRSALETADGAEREAEVRGWLQRYMLHPAGALAAGAGGDLIARAVAAFLGIG